MRYNYTTITLENRTFFVQYCPYTHDIPSNDTRQYCQIRTCTLRTTYILLIAYYAIEQKYGIRFWVKLRPNCYETRYFPELPRPYLLFPLVCTYKLKLQVTIALTLPWCQNCETYLCINYKMIVLADKHSQGQFYRFGDPCRDAVLIIEWWHISCLRPRRYEHIRQYLW